MKKTIDVCFQSRYPVYIFCILFLLVYPINDMMPFTMLDDDCIEKLDEAEDLYRTGGFDEAIEILTNCLEKGEMPQDETMRAYRLLGLAYIGQDYLEEARQAIARLLDLVPDYIPDPVQDPPTFARMVEDVRDEKEDNDLPEITEQEERSSIWYYIGGGILAAGAAVGAVLMLTGDDDDPELPRPPSLPD